MDPSPSPPPLLTTPLESLQTPPPQPATVKRHLEGALEALAAQIAAGPCQEHVYTAFERLARLGIGEELEARVGKIEATLRRLEVDVTNARALRAHRPVGVVPPSPAGGYRHLGAAMDELRPVT